MKKARILASILLATLFCYSHAHAQGCSDAGFCTIGALKPNQSLHKYHKPKLKSIDFTTYYGNTAVDVHIFSFIVDATFMVGKKNALQLKLPFNYNNGTLTSTSGIGDLSFSLSRPLLQNENFVLNGTIGGKIPSNSANLTFMGNSLPMYYQTSLGTYDAIAGVGLVGKGWLVTTGIQHAFNRVENDFFWGPWKGTEFEEHVLRYSSSRQLKRGTDVMLRVEKSKRFSNIEASLGLLAIYRVNRDNTFITGTQLFTQMGDSNGLAFNGLGSFQYNIDSSHSIKLMGALKISQRQKSFDGLTRDFVSTITYGFKF